MKLARFYRQQFINLMAEQQRQALKLFSLPMNILQVAQEKEA
jgi:hypothetical protein